MLNDKVIWKAKKGRVDIETKKLPVLTMKGETQQLPPEPLNANTAV